MDPIKYDYNDYDSKIKKSDWNVGPSDESNDRVNINNDLLAIKPEKHTLILVKEMLRCAHTLKKEHIGVMYERAVTKDNDSAQIQGLPGRVTGYGVPDDIIVFTNLGTIDRYNKIYEADGDLKKAGVTWNSTTTKNKNGIVVPRKPTFMGELSPAFKRKDTEERKYDFSSFNTWYDANQFKLRTFGKKFLKERFNNRKKDEHGRIMNHIRGPWKIINRGDTSDFNCGLKEAGGDARLLVTYDGDEKVPMFVVVWKKKSSI